MGTLVPFPAVLDTVDRVVRGTCDGRVMRRWPVVVCRKVSQVDRLSTMHVPVLAVAVAVAVALALAPPLAVAVAVAVALALAQPQ